MKQELVTGPFPALTEAEVDKAYDNIFQVFWQLCPSLPEQIKSRFKDASTLVHFDRGEAIVEYGQVCRHVYFMLYGLVASSFVLDDHGEKTVWYLSGGDIVIAIESFFDQSASQEKITALEPVACIAIPKADWEQLFEEFVEFNITGRKLAERYLRQALERFKWAQQSPKFRYKLMMTHFSHVVNKITKADLAAFLGIARETLHRMLRRFAQKKD